jgi:DNA-binding CsgD family transcriptional regulator/uncharacterized protein YhfF
MRSAHTESFWQAFACHEGINHADYQVTLFRTQPERADRLVALMEAGALRALTSPMHIFDEGRCEPMPIPGNYAVLVDHQRHPRLILHATGVTSGALSSVSDVFIWLTGSDSGEREDWLAGMATDFTHMSRLYGFEMHPEIDTVFETIEVVWPLDIARRIRLVTPHLDRGIALLQRLEQQRSTTEVIEAILRRMETAVLTLGPSLRVGYTNPAAEAVLRRGDGLRLKNGHLAARWPIDERRLASAISIACRGARGADQSSAAVQSPHGAGALISVRRNESLPPYRVSVFPLPRQHAMRGMALDAEAMIFVDDPIEDEAPAKADLWSDAFQLTPAEVRLAIHLVSGATLKDYAEEFGVTYNTARAQLRAIFEKTDTHRQAELVSLLQTSRSLRVSLS